MGIYDNIKIEARAKGISIRKLESDTGLSNGAISKWNISEPKILAIRKVAALLDVTIEDLLKK